MKDSPYLKIIFLAIFIFFLPFLINPFSLSGRDNDLGRNYIPIFSFIRQSIITYHQIPLWRPDQLMGETFIGNPVYSPFYPANILFMPFSPAIGSIIYLQVHILAAAISTYYLAKSFSLSKIAALAAALFYAFSIKMLVHIEAGHVTMIAAFSLFPLVFLSIRKVLNNYHPKWLAISSITLALMYFAYPTIFYYSFIFVALYWTYSILLTRRFHPPQFVRPFILFLSIAASSVLISAIELLPHLEFAPLSTRSQLRLEDVALPLWNLKKFTTSLLFPYLERELNHEAFLYLGLIPTILATIGFLTLSNLKKAIFLCGSGLLLLYVAGLSTPVFPLLYNYLPFLNYSRITTRPWFIMALLVALLGALTVDKIKNKKIIYAALALFLMEATLIFYQRLDSIPKLNFSNQAIYQFLQNDPDLYRVYCTTNCFNPQMLTNYQVQILNGENPVQQTEVVDFLQEAGNYKWDNYAVIFPPYQVWQTDNPPIPNATLLGEANVKYVASTYPLNSKDFVFLEKFENIFLYSNIKFKKRFRFENSEDQVNIARYSPNAVNLKFERQKTSATIVVSENFYEGWIASVVNQKFNVEKEDNLFKKVVIPPDTIDVWLKFQPKSYIIGRTITLGTLTFLLLFLIKTRKINEKNSHT